MVLGFCAAIVKRAVASHWVTKALDGWFWRWARGARPLVALRANDFEKAS